MFYIVFFTAASVSLYTFSQVLLPSLDVIFWCVCFVCNSLCLSRHEAGNEVCAFAFSLIRRCSFSTLSPDVVSKGVSCTTHLLESWFTKRDKVIFLWGDRTGQDRLAPSPLCCDNVEMALSFSHTHPPPHQVWRFVRGGQVSEASYWSEDSSRSRKVRPSSSRRGEERWICSAPASDRPGEGRVESSSSPHNLSFSFTWKTNRGKKPIWWDQLFFVF